MVLDELLRGLIKYVIFRREGSYGFGLGNLGWHRNFDARFEKNSYFVKIQFAGFSHRYMTMFFVISVKYHFNPLTANDELSRHENLTFLWTWILRWVPRSFATHASLCNTLSYNKLCPKTVKILAVKGLICVRLRADLDIDVAIC